MSTNALNLKKKNSYPNQFVKNNPNTNANQNVLNIWFTLRLKRDALCRLLITCVVY